MVRFKKSQSQSRFVYDSTALSNRTFFSMTCFLRVSLVRLFEKVHNEKVEFQKAECLVKTVKKCIMKKLSVWLVLIKVAF